MDALFDLPETLSPRLQWIQRHGVSINRDDSPGGIEFGPYFASVPTSPEGHPNEWMSCIGSGPTEDDALVDLARNQGLRLWNEETA